MLEELKADNFLSWLNLSFKPQEMNLLVGLNNSGKTNLCKAIQFLAATAWFSLDQCANHIVVPIFNLTNASYKKPGIDFSIVATVPEDNGKVEARYEYQLTLSVVQAQQTPGKTLVVNTERLTVSDSDLDDKVLLENNAGEVRLLHEQDALKGNPHYVNTTAPLDTTMLQRLYDLQTNAKANRFKRYLRTWQYYSFSETALRDTAYKPNNPILASDGSNLASAIHILKKSDERSYRTLLEYIRVVEPNLDYINVFGGDTEPFVLMNFDHSSGLKLPAFSASSGTLRFVAMAYVLLVQSAFVHRPLIMIEEPENGIYVGCLRKILEMASHGANTPQLIFTSHSPYLIDLFDNRLDSVFVVKRDEHHSAVSNIDVAKARKHLEEYPLGEQHFRNMLA